MIGEVKVLPSWVPGMGFKSKANECRRLTHEALNAPYTWVKRRLVSIWITDHIFMWLMEYPLEGARKCSTVDGG